MQGDNNAHGVGFVQQILSLQFVPRKNGTNRENGTVPLSNFQEMWYGIFLWAFISSLVFHLPAALLALVTLRRHKLARFLPLAIMLMGIVGPLLGGVLTSAAIAGVYMAAGKKMVYLEVLVFGVAQSFFVLVISFLRVLATL
ncbi:transmembrane protein 170A [Brachyhypopomus gauderio]|uniref:transmembrane protein 170A n=1 Tax=Brachyhypopomus gauderio TaxID=698409 RepID=UPI0040415CB8